MFSLVSWLSPSCVTVMVAPIKPLRPPARPPSPPAAGQALVVWVADPKLRRVAFCSYDCLHRWIAEQDITPWATTGLVPVEHSLECECCSRNLKINKIVGA